jgi:hypothetical protein
VATGEAHSPAEMVRGTSRRCAAFFNQEEETQRTSVASSVVISCQTENRVLIIDAHCRHHPYPRLTYYSPSHYLSVDSGPLLDN